MIKKLSGIILLLFSGVMSSYAQVGTGFSSSPGSASLTSAQKESQVRVNLYTGIPEISVPLFSYNNNGLGLNLALNYYAGGIKVEEEASDVGLGWNLNIGGLVMRTVRGIPDDYPVRGFTYQGVIPATMDSALQSKYFKDSLDTEADVFTYNINGHSGNFLIGKDGGIKLETPSLIKIEPVYNPSLAAYSTLASFKITLEDGTVCYFTERSTMKNEELNTSNPSFMHNKDLTVSWGMSSMIAPFATDTISFTYTTITTGAWVNFPSNYTYGTGYSYLYNGRGRQTTIIKKVTSAILPNEQQVRFIYKERYDKEWSEDSIISLIKVLDKGEYIYGYKFDYYYVNNITSSVYNIKNRFIPNYEFKIDSLGAGTPSSEYVRVFLKSVTPITATGMDRPYEFEYNTQYFLPPTNESSATEVSVASRDSWGYFNGKINTTSIPSWIGYPAGADRSESRTYVLAGSIRKVIFPNGGYREYEFESNERKFLSVTVPGGGLRIKKISEYAGIGQPPVVKEYRYLEEDGVTSSGYLAFWPKFDYTYNRVDGSGNTNVMTVINSEALNNLNFTSGMTIGYGRVEVIEGTAGGTNSGKTVCTFTDFSDISIGEQVLAYPYVPLQIASWGLGLPQRVMIYNSAGRLMRSTTNTYDIKQFSLGENIIKSIKFGISKVNANGSYELFSQAYYPLYGRSDLIKTVDSTFFDDGSSVVFQGTFEYSATNFRLKKSVKDLDRVKGTKIEKRFYYADDYALTTGAVKSLKDLGIVTLIANEEWIVGDANPRITGAEITDFQILPNNIIKPYKTYLLRSSAAVPLAQVGNFNPAVLNRNPALFKVANTLERFDERGTLLQAINSAGIRNVVIPSEDKKVPLANIQNATYDEVAYTSFEGWQKGNWTYSGATASFADAITGERVYDLAGGAITKTGLPAKDYIISFWHQGGSPAVPGATLIRSETNTVRGWTFQEYKATNATSVTIQGTGTLDELRLLPEAASMSTVAYKPFIGSISTADIDNSLMYYEFDQLLRTKLFRNADKKIVQKQEYGYNGITHTNPIWEFTGNKRCAQAQYGNTGHLEVEQVNTNFSSATYMSTQWITIGVTSKCPPVPYWQATGLTRCLKTSDNDNTGYYEKEEINMNSYSSTYNQKRWVAGGFDRTLCPDLCIAPYKKIVNGVCETGVKRYVRSRATGNGDYYCFYVYDWSDGTHSPEYRETVPTLPCE